MKQTEIINKIRNNDELQFALDDIIHDRFSSLASVLNNQGVVAQLKWLEEKGENIKKIFDEINS